eukprot:6367229-Prymnesium_polylepis.2
MPVFHGLLTRQDLIVEGRSLQCGRMGDFSPLPRGRPAWRCRRPSPPDRHRRAYRSGVVAGQVIQ